MTASLGDQELESQIAFLASEGYICACWIDEAGLSRPWSRGSGPAASVTETQGFPAPGVSQGFRGVYGQRGFGSGLVVMRIITYLS